MSFEFHDNLSAQSDRPDGMLMPDTSGSSVSERPRSGSYVSLARKYRPSRFDDLVGQELAVKALLNAVRLEREPQGVVFSGTRGVGKTTLARLYAKALNCEDRSSPEPCDRCESCLLITSGQHEDVLEIDGASHTGVDDVRALRETLEYVAQRSRFKVYIIDEVHMLSQSAFNALLKSLEEPPAHVVFVFATTELHKIPQTILSRCLSFQLNKIPVRLIRERLAEILKSERVPYAEQALLPIAEQGHGSMRDALTLLDQAIAMGGGKLEVEDVDRLCLRVSVDTVFELLQALLDRKATRVMEIVEDIDARGLEMISFVEELTTMLRHGFMVKELGVENFDPMVTGLSDPEFQVLSEMAEQSPPFELHRLFRECYQLRLDLQGSYLDRFVVENSFLEWCLDPGLPEVTDLLQVLQTKPASSAPSPAKIRQQLDPSQSQSPGQPNAAQSQPKPRPTVRQSLQAQVSGHVEQATETALVRPPEKPHRQEQGQRPLTQSARVQGELSEGASKQSSASAQPLMQTSAASTSTSASPAASPEASQAAPKVSPTAPKVSPPPLKASPSAPASPAVTEKPAVEFPESWELMVEAWKRYKPFQARKLEEVRCVVYSSDLIQLLVPSSGLAADVLLDPNGRQQVEKQLVDYFAFDGELRVLPEGQGMPQPPAAKRQAEPSGQPKAGATVSTEANQQPKALQSEGETSAKAGHSATSVSAGSPVPAQGGAVQPSRSPVHHPDARPDHTRADQSLVGTLRPHASEPRSTHSLSLESRSPEVHAREPHAPDSLASKPVNEPGSVTLEMAGHAATAPHLTPSIMEQKAARKAQRRADVERKVKDDPLTTYIVKTLGADTIQVQFKGDLADL